jgi:hypothetical protein
MKDTIKVLFVLLGNKSSEGLWFKANLGKEFERSPFQLMAGHGGLLLSPQLHGRLRLGRLLFWVNLGKKTPRPHLN